MMASLSTSSPGRTRDPDNQSGHLVWRQRLDVVVLDASDSLSEAARTAAAIEALHPQVGVLIVCDDERPKPATALPIMEKWEALETLSDDIRRSYASATN